MTNPSLSGRGSAGHPEDAKIRRSGRAKASLKDD